MRLFAIADLHLPGGDDKPMNVFGPHWEHHFDRIRDDWRSRVGSDDIVLIPGDISWAMYLKDAQPDLDAIAGLPGRKVLLRGNHDYWWSSLTQVRACLKDGMYALQNDALDMGEIVVAGTRGWLMPAPDTVLEEKDQRIFERELIRLRISLEAAMGILNGRPLIVMTHYPPLSEALRDTPVTRLLREYPVAAVLYGHLHGTGIQSAFNGVADGIPYRLVSCDALGFRLAEIGLEEGVS